MYSYQYTQCKKHDILCGLGKKHVVFLSQSTCCCVHVVFLSQYTCCCVHVVFLSQYTCCCVHVVFLSQYTCCCVHVVFLSQYTCCCVYTWMLWIIPRMANTRAGQHQEQRHRARKERMNLFGGRCPTKVTLDCWAPGWFCVCVCVCMRTDE